MSEKTLHSLHCFMFPFRWDYISDNRDKDLIPFSSRTRLADFDRVFSQCNTLKRTPFTIGNDFKKFNEYSYFHDFVRKALYDTNYSDKIGTDVELAYYEKNGNDSDFFKIYTLEFGEYNLSIESVCLHAYSTGVGVLTFNLNNTEYSTIEDVLRINEFGRRLYPQFIVGNSLESTKKAFLADRIEGKIGDISFNENFEQYLNGIEIDSSFLPPDYVKKVFGFRGKEKEGEDMAFVFRKSHESKGKIRISKITDDRMFFVSWLGNGKMANSLAKDYLKNDQWYAFVFGDKNPKSIANDEMQEKVIESSTYTRWSKYGTLFGMTRDSFVAISNTISNLERNGAPNLYEHMRTMYYQMAVLCLAQRASLLRFSHEISLITNSLENSDNPSKKIQDIYKNYIQFINKIYFREVTSQIQGIEMYHQFQNVMNLEDDVKMLDEEISELHQYVSIVESSTLSNIALWFLPVGAIIGFLGINVFDKNEFGFKDLSIGNLSIFQTSIIWLIFIGLCSFVVVKLFLKFNNKNIK